MNKMNFQNFCGYKIDVSKLQLVFDFCLIKSWNKNVFVFIFYCNKNDLFMKFFNSKIICFPEEKHLKNKKQKILTYKVKLDVLRGYVNINADFCECQFSMHSTTPDTTHMQWQWLHDNNQSEYCNILLKIFYMFWIQSAVEIKKNMIVISQELM